MSLNITAEGFVYDSNVALGNSDIYYQAYFYKNNTSSSNSKWNNTRICEQSGYWNLNAGDADFLGQSGIALTNSKIVVVFWRGGADRLADCGVITEWGVLEIVLTTDSFYTQDAQIKSNILPNLIWSNNIPAHSYTNTNYTVTNNSTDIHSWIFNGIQSASSVTMNHWFTKYNQTIFNVNTISETDYLWGDGKTSLNLIGAANATHNWDTPGTYIITMKVRDKCNEEVTDTTTVEVFHKGPVLDIVRCDSNGNILSSTVSTPDTKVYFKYNGTDINTTITSIDWEVKDSGVYGNTDTLFTTNNVDSIIEHTNGIGTSWKDHIGTSGAFTNPGKHMVTITVHWFDGWNTNTTSYSKEITQGKFSGPSVNFQQYPSQAVIASGITFINKSTNTDRVGLGSPDYIKYDWYWADNETSTSISDVDYTYEFNYTPNYVDCGVQLCANWSDGWDTKETCIDKDVVFSTTVTVSPEDCYYILDIIGTSSDGTITDYSWTISSGISDVGPWDTIWDSPVGIAQNNKPVSFTDQGWYKIQGRVHGGGNTTTDDKILEITEVCIGGDCLESVINIWNGTGPLDIGVDWVHSGVGIESESANYKGTNGLLIRNSNDSDKLFFTSNGEIDINNYDFLSFWVNIQEWGEDKDIYISTYNSKNNTSNEVDLSNYIIYSNMGKWNKITIDLRLFNNDSDTSSTGWPTYIDEIMFRFNGRINMWIDDVVFNMGTIITVPVCAPDMNTYEVGAKAMQAKQIPPPVATSIPGVGTPNIRTSRPYPYPNTDN